VPCEIAGFEIKRVFKRGRAGEAERGV